MQARVPDMREVNVVSFDCYGTLVDWESGILDSLQPLLAAHGAFPPAARILESYAAHEAAAESGPYTTYRQVLRQVVKGFGMEYGFAPSSEELECLSRSLPGWRPFEDTPGALARLAKRVRLAVISNVDDDLFEATRAVLGVKLDFVVTSQQVRSYKPAAGNFQTLRYRLGVRPGTVLHAAQSLFHDIVPAGGAGFRTAWINRPSRRPGLGATPSVSGSPDLVVADLRSLADLLGA